MMKWFAGLLLITLPWALYAAQPKEHYGQWSGMVAEPGGKGSFSRYQVTINILPGEITVDYPSLGCGGHLVPLPRKGRHLGFREHLEYGLEQCAKGGRTELFLISPELAAYQWYDAEGRLRAEGMLKRRRQVVMFKQQQGGNTHAYSRGHLSALAGVHHGGVGGA